MRKVYDEIILTLLKGCAVGPSASLRLISTGHEAFLDQTKERLEDRLVDQTIALQIARKHAEQNYGSVEGYDMLACEQGLLWRVFLEPRNATGEFSGLEYIVSKLGGKILRQRRLAFAGTNNQDLSATAKIDRKEAIAIAKKMVTAYRSLVRYRVTVCELSSVWVVVFSPESKLDGGGPEYVIDKQRGDILDKQYYQ